MSHDCLDDVGIEPFTFVCTCCSCPEQYDMFCDGVLVGYVRLRNYTLTAYQVTDGKELSQIDWETGPFYHFKFSEWRLNVSANFNDDGQKQYYLKRIIEAWSNLHFA